MAAIPDDVLDAAERIARDRGVGAVTMRAVAEEANYGKSTIHTLAGSKEDLLAGLAERGRAIITSRMKAIGDVEDRWEQRFRTTAAFILECPEMAELVFRFHDQGDLVAWSIPFRDAFGKDMAEALDGVGDVAIAKAMDITHRQLADAIPLIVETGDAEFGAGVVERGFSSFVATAHALEAQEI